jgi:hypothetical protein
LQIGSPDLEIARIAKWGGTEPLKVATSSVNIYSTATSHLTRHGKPYLQIIHSSHVAKGVTFIPANDELFVVHPSPTAIPAPVPVKKFEEVLLPRRIHSAQREAATPNSPLFASA